MQCARYPSRTSVRILAFACNVIDKEVKVKLLKVEFDENSIIGNQSSGSGVLRIHFQQNGLKNAYGFQKDDQVGIYILDFIVELKDNKITVVDEYIDEYGFRKIGLVGVYYPNSLENKLDFFYINDTKDGYVVNF